MDSVGLDKQDS